MLFNNRIRIKKYSITVSLGAVLLLASCASIDKGMMAISDGMTTKDAVTGARELNFTSDESEVKKASEVSAQILDDAKQKGLKIDADLPQYAQIVKVFDRLKKVSHRQELPWEIHEIENNAFNAFTVGGGKMFIYSGLFDKDMGVQNDDELAAVIAHEMGHVSARHVSEAGAKMMAVRLADKNAAARGTFSASFTTVQEDEADKLAVLYCALAGFNPEAGANIWTRMDEKYGSNTGGLLYDHPLSDDRAKNIKQYAAKTQKYYKRDKLNPIHTAILENNTLFQKDKAQEMQAGEGGGFLALLETAANAYTENLNTQSEELNRQSKQLSQISDAMRIYQLTGMKISSAQGGGKGIFAKLANTTNKKVEQATGRIDYYLNGQVVYQKNVILPTLSPYESQDIGYTLDAVQYDSASITPTYIKFED